MSYSYYEHYKNSGENNIGLIPQSWKVAKLYLLSKRYAGGTPDKNTSEYWENGTVPWLNSGSVNQFLITSPTTYITSDALEKSSAKWVPKGALLIALAGQGKTKGMVAQTTFDTTCNQSMAAIICRKFNSRYLLWWLVSQYENIRGLSSLDGRDGLNLEMIGGIKCPIPSSEEQKAIAAFLDKKSSEIDTLIAKKQKLIQLLEEKRSALITQVVTKGLYSDVPLKESYLPWLNSIPTHWSIKKFQHTSFVKARIGWQNLRSDEFTDDGPYCVTGTDFMDGKVNWSTAYHVSEQRYDLDTNIQLMNGDLLITKDGTIGKLALIDALPAKATLNSGIFVTRPLSNDYSNAFMYWLLSSQVFNDFIKFMNTGTTINHLYQHMLERFKYPLPPIEEQKVIVRFLVEETKKIDSIKSKIEEAIQRLKEYRSALIAYAVTGKIDVRPNLVRVDKLAHKEGTL
ncbi:TPA: restriction endonuclease subunit S [Legionella pneumophila]|nr:restriction endonuclease subunit S [Legionella pneumophila]HAT1987219.1 restriction endonuclease subunit S [Legionella pneumophila]HAT8744788.1 restriction endonuclease subunit S [Legionella pneumophila]